MNAKDLKNIIKEKRTLLCVGLDTDLDKIPPHLKKTEDPIFEFNKQIIDATHDLAIAFKVNTAFYEAQGCDGWNALTKTSKYIKENYPTLLTIADAKRGDIGNTSKMYAKAFFDNMNFDAITITPYMGKDTAEPFLEYKDKWVILLALSSNPSAFDLQLIQETGSREYLFEKVIKYGQWWGNEDNIMYVVGAMMAYKLQQIRHIVPNHFLLVPGIGDQGGSLKDVCDFGLNKNYGLIINSSRSIIYADNSEKFAERAREEAKKLQTQMDVLLTEFENDQKRKFK
jgi:orotidine-5'-phosphate decarboxylase